MCPCPPVMVEPPPGLDPGITNAVTVLIAAGIETFESCQGGEGHPYPEPTVRFHGHPSEGFKALAAAEYGGLRPSYLRRIWVINEYSEPVGPYWEMVFNPVRKLAEALGCDPRELTEAQT